MPPVKDPDFVLFCDSLDALDLFLKLQSQYNYTSMGDLIGLNYSSVIDVIRLHEQNKKTRIQLFDEIRAIESGYLAAKTEDKK